MTINSKSISKHLFLDNLAISINKLDTLENEMSFYKKIFQMVILHKVFKFISHRKLIQNTFEFHKNHDKN